MKVIKLDRRHRNSDKYTTAIQFSKWEFKARKHWPYRKALEQLFGEESVFEFFDTELKRGPGKWRYNENYRIDRSMYRVNVRDAEVITMLELMVPHD